MVANGLPQCLVCGEDCSIYQHPGGRRCACIERFVHPVARATATHPHYFIICAQRCEHCGEIHQHVRGIFPVQVQPALSRDITPGYPKHRKG